MCRRVPAGPVGLCQRLGPGEADVAKQVVVQQAQAVARPGKAGGGKEAAAQAAKAGAAQQPSGAKKAGWRNAMLASFIGIVAACGAVVVRLGGGAAASVSSLGLR